MCALRDDHSSQRPFTHWHSMLSPLNQVYLAARLTEERAAEAGGDAGGMRGSRHLALPWRTWSLNSPSYTSPALHVKSLLQREGEGQRRVRGSGG